MKYTRLFIHICLALAVLALAIVVLVAVAPAGHACPPGYWVDKISWQQSHNFTEAGGADGVQYWRDSSGALHNVTFESHTDQNNILGYRYGDYYEWYTFTMDGQVIISGSENLDEKHRQHMANYSPMAAMAANWPCLVGPVGILAVLLVISLVLGWRDNEGKM